MDNAQYLISQQHIQNISIRLEILDNDNNVIDELSGNIISLGISSSAESLIRNTCDITMKLDDESLIPTDSDSVIWINKKFRLYVIVNDVEFNKGYYYFSDLSLETGLDFTTLSFKGLDSMKLLDEQQLEYITKIPHDTPMFEAIKQTLAIANINKYSINDVDYVIPYDIELDAESSVLDLLVKIRDLYSCHEIYFDEYGTFVFQKIRNRKYDNIVYSFENNDETTISFTNNPDWNNVKNKIILYGAESYNGSQIKVTIENQNNNKFGSEYIGVKPLVISDDMVMSQEQAELRAEYELFIHSSLNESVNISSICNYALQVNNIVKVNCDRVGLNGTYLINKIDYSIDGVMNIDLKKMYY